MHEEYNIHHGKDPVNYFNVQMLYRFVQKKTKTTWAEMLFMIRYEYLEKTAAIEKAISDIAEQDEIPDEVIDLSWAGPNEYILDYVEKLSQKETITVNIEKIVYLLMAWVYEHKEKYTSSKITPLAVVEEIYFDFGSPVELETIIRYTTPMKIERLSIPDRELYQNWEKYLQDEKKKLQASS